jgi:hypothetical protein
MPPSLPNLGVAEPFHGKLHCFTRFFQRLGVEPKKCLVVLEKAAEIHGDDVVG